MVDLKKKRNKNDDEKTRDTLNNTVASLFIKGFGMILSLFSMPLYIVFFNNQMVLGLWYTMLSMLNWINMFDFGLSNGLRNNLVEPIEKKNVLLISKLLSSTLFALIIIAVSLIAISVIVLYFVDIKTIFNIDDGLLSDNQLLLVMVILIIGVAVSFSLRIITALNYAFQKAALNNLIMLVSTAMPILGIVLLRKMEFTLYEKLLIMAIIHVAASWIPVLLSYVYIKSNIRLMRLVRLSINYFDKKIAKDTIKLGGVFFIAQSAFLLITQTNQFLITLFFSVEYVVNYQACYTVFVVFGTILQVGLSPVWSAVTKANIQKDYNWLRKLTYILYGTIVVGFISELIVALSSNWIIKIWLQGGAFEVEPVIAICFMIYGTCYIATITLTTLANGLGKLKPQMIVYSIGAIIKVPTLLICRTVFPDAWYIVIVIDCTIFMLFSIIQIISIEMYFKSLYFRREFDNVEF